MDRRPGLIAITVLVLAVVVGGVVALRAGDPAGAGPASPSAAASASQGPVASTVAGPTTPAGSATPAAAETAARLLGRCLADTTGADRDDCLAMAFIDLVMPLDDPRPALAAISDAAWGYGGYLLTNCHGMMHTIGREYAAAHAVTLDRIMDFLPDNNDPGCTAGFSHGLVTGVAAQIDLSRPAEAVKVCDAAETRFQRYSCVHGFGHAFMRIYDENLEPALGKCAALGERAAPDCAQGAFHDYWFAAIGVDGTTAPPDQEQDPRVLCAAQQEAFVRGCWYRAFIDTRPAGFQVTSVVAIEDLCGDLDGLQRSACVTAASVIGPPDPADQLVLCSSMIADDAVSCVRGTKVQNLLKQPPEAFVALVDQCSLFPGETGSACYRWLGKVVAVVTDGAFETVGCPRLASPAGREACIEGARSMDEALVTFS